MHLARDANGLASRGYPTTVMVIGSDLSAASELSPKITVHSLRGKTSSPLSILKLAADLRKRRADIVIAWSVYANLVVATLSALGWIGRSILVENNYPPLSYAQMPAMRRSVVYLAVRILYRYGSVVVANSAEILEYLRESLGPGPRLARIRNPVNIEELETRAQETVSFGKQPGQLIILAAGRMTNYQKGFDVLLNACAKLRDHPVDWALWMVGDGEDLAYLKSLCEGLRIQDRVVWLGMKPNPFPYYRAADLIVVPSNYEGFPNILLEAMALGKATVSTDCKTGPRELTQDGRHGLLTPVGDSGALASAIGLLLLDEGRRNELGDTAAAYVSEAHSEDRVLADVEAIIASL